MNEESDYALVPRPSSGVECVEPRANRLLAVVVKDLLALAPVEDAETFFQKGCAYLLGDSVAANIVEALKWLRLAAERGHINAQLGLGSIYGEGSTDGLGFDFVVRCACLLREGRRLSPLGTLITAHKDTIEAAKWFRMAANQSNAEAQFHLGVMYCNGEGVPKDEIEAATWFRLAADQGNRDAQYWIGWMNHTGTGMRKNNARALQWFRKAAEENHNRARYFLGVMYANGQGVTRDAVQAVAWYHKAAAGSRPDTDAQNELALCYWKGEGVPKNDILAAAWFRKAAEQGNGEAQALLRILFPQNR